MRTLHATIIWTNSYIAVAFSKKVTVFLGFLSKNGAVFRVFWNIPYFCCVQVGIWSKIPISKGFSVISLSCAILQYNDLKILYICVIVPIVHLVRFHRHFFGARGRLDARFHTTRRTRWRCLRNENVTPWHKWIADSALTWELRLNDPKNTICGIE